LQFKKICQPYKSVAMGSHISGLMAEIFLQNYEQYIVKNILDSNKINFYNRYVDDIIIIFDNNHTNANDILNYMNKVHKDLQFKATEEIDNTISFLDLLITRNHNKLLMDIYRKPTTTDTITCPTCTVRL
jgi:predicted RND superfamily exporter protein